MAPNAGNCTKCKKPASVVCNGCNDAPSLDGGVEDQTWYCSRECQVADWPDHKQLCKKFQNRKALFRAGGILQEIFYMYREKMFDRIIVRIEDKAEKFYIYGGQNKIKDAAQRVFPDHYLERFPSELFTTLEEKHAALADMACTEASMWMSSIARYFLNDIATEVIEVDLSIRKKRRETITIHFNGIIEPPHDHSIFKVKLESTEEYYALDLSGAQYGYHDTVIPWNHYVASRAPRLLQFRPLGSTVEKFSPANMAMRNESSAVIVTVNLNQDCHRILLKQTLDWEHNTKSKVKALVTKTGTDEFVKKPTELVGHIAFGIDFYVDSIKKQCDQGRLLIRQGKLVEAGRLLQRV